MTTTPVVHSDPEIMGGTPVFVGTRVPVQALIDYLEDGHSLSEFLEDFPTVKREQTIAALEHAKQILVSSAYGAAGGVGWSHEREASGRRSARLRLVPHR